MKILFVIAMERESLTLINHYKLKKITNNYYKKDDIELLITEVSRNGVTSALVNHILDNNVNIKDYIMINVGMVGSNNLNVGDVVMVNKSYGYNFDLTMFGAPLYTALYSPFNMDTISNKKLVPCYTSDSFVLSTDIKEPSVFDMELNSIITFPFKKKYSIKVVSDSLDNKAYESFDFDNYLPQVYDLIDEIIKENE